MARDALVGVGGRPLSADILRHLLESSQDVLYAVALDPVHMLYATPAFARRMGLPEDFLARGYAFGEYLLSVHPDDQGRVAEGMGAIVASRSDADLPENPARYRLRTPEGGWRAIEDTYRILRDADGVPHTLIGNARDVSEQSEARRALAENEARFRSLAENSRDLFFSMRFPEGRFDYLSPSYGEVTGFSPEEHYADPGIMFRVIAPDWREPVARWLEDIRRGNVVESYEFQIVDRFGRLRWLHQRQVLVPAPDGRGTLLQGVATDVTDLRQARQSLVENEARFRSLAENSRDVFFSFRLPEGRYEFISSKVADILGHTAQDFYADPGLFLRCVAPQWRGTMAGWNAEIAQGQVQDKYEFEVLDRHGRLRWIVERLVLVPAPDGQGMLLQGVAADITEERGAREALRASEEHFRQLIEAWPEQVMLSVNLTAGRHEYVSPSMERVLGYAPQEFYDDPGLGMRVVAPQWQEQAWAWIAELRQGIVRPAFEFELVHKNGQHRWIHQVGVLRPHAPGQGLVVQFTFRDITEERGAREALRASEERYRQLAEGWLDQIVIRFNLHTGRYEYVSPGMEKVFGFAPEEFYRDERGFVGRTVAPEWRETVQEWLAEARAGALRPEYEYELIDAWGARRWVQQHCTLLHAADGTPEVVQGVLYDNSERHRLEEELRASRAFLDCIIEQSPMSMWISDEKGTLIRSNQALREQLKITDEEVVGRFNIFNDNQALEQGFMPQIRRVYEQGGTARFSLAYDTARTEGLDLAQSSRTILDLTISAVQDAKGKTTNLIIQHLDISEHKRLEEELRASKAFLDCIIEQSPMSMWISDETGTLIRSNQALRKLFQVSEEEVVGRFNIFQDNQSLEQGFMPQVRRVYEQGGTTRFMLPYNTARIEGLELSRSSTAFLDVTISAVQDAQGKITNLIVQHLDISEHKRTEAALFKSERLSRKLLESMHEGVWAVDANRRTTFVNERLCAMLGYASTELMNMSPTDVLEWPQRHVAKSQLSDLEAGYSGATDYVLIRKDGSRFPAHVVSSPVMEEQGRFEGLVCGVVDLTERARMEHELRRNQARFEALYELSRLTPATEHRLASFTLREAIRLTDSSAGVLFFVSEDGQQLVPKAWETGEFMGGGQVPSFPASGPLPWARVLQSGHPLLVNDIAEFANMIPPWHPPMSRLLGVPALDGSRPVAVLGLTGKDEPYTAEDTLQTTLLLDGMWRVVRARRDEERIRASLREKEALLHEVHHRVKNNLQVISSLMDMAGRRLSSAEARASLEDLRGKVQAMSLIHAQLHGARSDGGISLERFVRALFHQLRELYSGGLSLSLVVELSNLALGVDQAVPLGLALNEALTNVFKHASSEGRAGKVSIRAGQDATGQVCILVRDNGPGLPEGFDPGRAQSLGMKLMHGLVRHQLGGKLEVLNCVPPERSGVEVCICFRAHIAK